MKQSGSVYPRPIPATICAFALTLCGPLLLCSDVTFAQQPCPALLQFETTPAKTDIDFGWSGLFHDAQLDASVSFTVSNCDATSSACGTCDVSGPVDNPDSSALSRENHRCSCNTSQRCSTDSDCSGCGCAYFLGAPIPILAGISPVCVTNQIAGAASGSVTTDQCTVTSGTISMNLLSRFYTGAALDEPCPLCDDGLCSAGPRAGLACSANSSYPLLGSTSFDCPPASAANLTGAGLPVTLDLHTGTQTFTLSNASPGCSATGFTDLRCFCSTCSGSSSIGCSSDADCTAAGAGTCTASGAPGAATRPNSCGNGVCTPNTPPDLDSINEGVCLEGPFISLCDGDSYGLHWCTDDFDCEVLGLGSCSIIRSSQCFTDNGITNNPVSVGDPDNPGLGAFSCVGATVSSGVNYAAGLPGPARFSLPGTMTLSPCCDREGSELDEDADEDVATVGDISSLYPSYNTALTSWYLQLPCGSSIGGEEEPTDDDPDGPIDFGDGEPPMTQEEFVTEIEEPLVVEETAHSFTDASAVSGPYTPPVLPHVPDPNGCYVFGGRDIVFVHGLRNRVIAAAVNPELDDHANAIVAWKPSTAANYDFALPGGGVNDTFYGNGYFKQQAEEYWDKHINRFLTQRGIKNRYLIVAWSSAQRLELGARAVLTQISDAMRLGTGVKIPGRENDVLTDAETAAFGTPSFVVISHSTGAPLTDVAMAAAAAPGSTLQADFVPKLAKAHIAFAGAFSGSNLATSALKCAREYGKIRPACRIAKWSGPPFNFFADERWRIKDTVLADLDPATMQGMWGNGANPNRTCSSNADCDEEISTNRICNPATLKCRGYLDRTPVRTLTVAGGHPSGVAREVKRTMLRGYDDGVLTINSQAASPNTVGDWPSGYHFSGDYKTLKDMGVPVNRSLWAIRQLDRRRGYYRDKKVDPMISALVSAAVTPYLSPTGMREGKDELSSTQDPNLDPFTRYTNHFDFLQSASDHFGSVPGSDRECEMDGGEVGEQALCRVDAQCTPGKCREIGACKEDSDDRCWVGSDFVPSDCTCEKEDFNGVFYAKTQVSPEPEEADITIKNVIREEGHNSEEVNVVSNDAVYRPYGMFFYSDLPNADQSLLTEGDPLMAMEEICRGKPKRRNKNAVCGGGGDWKWQRKYHVLKGWHSKNAAEYVYGAVLASPPSPSCDCSRSWSTEYRQCVTGVLQATRKFVDGALEIKQKCRNTYLQLGGGFDLDATCDAFEAPTMSQLRGALRKTIASKCALTQAQIAEIGYPGRCEERVGGSTSTLADLQACMNWGHTEIVEDLVDIQYGLLSQPLSKSALACQSAIAASARKFTVENLKLAQKCRRAYLKGGNRRGLPCEDCSAQPKAVAKLAKLKAAAAASINQGCAAANLAELDPCSLQLSDEIACILDSHGKAVESDDAAGSLPGFIDLEYPDASGWR